MCRYTAKHVALLNEDVRSVIFHLDKFVRLEQRGFSCETSNNVRGSQAVKKGTPLCYGDVNMRGRSARTAFALSCEVYRVV